MKIALLGGTFDPPHLAHVQVLQHLLQSKAYDEIWVLPSRRNPFKDSSTSFDHRLKMCHLAFDFLGPQVQVKSDEKNLSGYTIDLVKHLIKKFPNNIFYFVAGNDLQKQLSQWKETENLQKWVTFVFLPRAPDPDSPFMDLSSTEIRKKAVQNKSLAGLVPSKVEKYIHEHNLYQDES